MMDERRITEAEFDAAVKQVMEELISNPKIEGMAKLMIPMTGHMFTDDMKKILFPKENKKATE